MFKQHRRKGDNTLFVWFNTEKEKWSRKPQTSFHLVCCGGPLSFCGSASFHITRVQLLHVTIKYKWKIRLDMVTYDYIFHTKYKYEKIKRGQQQQFKEKVFLSNGILILQIAKYVGRIQHIWNSNWLKNEYHCAKQQVIFSLL